MQYNHTLEALLNIHAYGIIHGSLGPPDSTTDSSSLIITEPLDDPVFVDFFLGYYDCLKSIHFQREMSSAHVVRHGRQCQICTYPKLILNPIIMLSFSDKFAVSSNRLPYLKFDNRFATITNSITKF
jgi:hypothetical protein